MAEDTWAALADQFVDVAYASVKGRVHQHLLEASRRDPYRALSRVFHLVGRAGG